MSRYGFVHLEFGSAQRQPSMQVLGKLRAALMHEGDTSELVIVDNASVRSNEIYRGAGFAAAWVLEGDNSNLQFTGWDKGVASLLARVEEPHCWIFTSDTVARLAAWSDRRAALFGAEVRRLGQYRAPWLLGEINEFPRPMTTPAGSCTEYVSTCCFAMNRLLRQQLDKLSPDNMLLDSLVYDSFEPGRGIFRDRLDPVLAELNEPSFDNLRMQARCRMSEAMLSVRALQLGAAIRSAFDAPSAHDRLPKLQHKRRA